jgi:hypothetical protein
MSTTTTDLRAAEVKHLIESSSRRRPFLEEMYMPAVLHIRHEYKEYNKHLFATKFWTIWRA